MGKHKKRKNYDIYISPYEERLYATRKLLFALAAIATMMNFLIVAALDDAMEKAALSALLYIVLFIILQFIPNFKKNWELGQAIISSALLFLFSAFLVFKSALIFMRYVWSAEFLLFCVFTFLLLRKKKKK